MVLLSTLKFIKLFAGFGVYKQFTLLINVRMLNRNARQEIVLYKSSLLSRIFPFVL